MKKAVKKVMLIGLDAPIAPRVYRYALEGKLPATKKLIEGGVYANNCMVPFPTITPPNWTTIVTGAWPGTHGITCFNVHIPGDPLNKTHQGFDTRDCQSEYIWNTAEKEGKKTIILNYPSTWPSTLKEGIQIAGAGLSVNEWRDGTPFECTLSHDLLFSTEEYPQGNTIELEEAAGWQNLAGAGKSLEAALKLNCRRPKFKVEVQTWHLLVLETPGTGFDRILISKTKDAKDAFVDLRPGEWSKNIVQEFQTEEGPKRAVFRCKLLELSPDARKFKLYFTGFAALDGWSYPESIAQEIHSEEGLPQPYGGFEALNLEWIDPQTFLEVIEFQHIWLADAAEYLLKNKPWDLFFMHAHCPDWAYHSFATKMDPLTAKDEAEATFWQGIELAFYQSLDRMMERVISCADEQTLIIIVSDHGAKATTHHFPLVKILTEAGLMAHKQLPDGTSTIDWSKTKAVPQRSCYIYVNLKGRDPDGIVEPGEEYEKVREEIIKALYEYTDPETGRKPVALALRREDARILGLYGDRIGDIVFALTEHFGGQHGVHLPTARYGLGDMRGLLIMAGPGIKKNFVLERNVWLTDIVPTICYLADLPIPKDAEGAIIYQALEDPDMKLHELETLRRNYERLKSAYEKEKALTHTYHQES